ncbi:MAG: hypothetical protein M1833_001438 [Piccolia ochrophora]|nr:MAG: hypothetical protein M1833_001438 [Piccolia ochrophora]
MHFAPALVVVLAAIPSAFSADIFRTTGANCGGSRIGCKDIQENRCCRFSAGVRQVLYTLPANSRGQAFSSAACSGSSFVFANPRAGTVCRSFNSGRPILSARWLQGLSSSARIQSEPESQDAVEPNFAEYTTKDGQDRNVTIPDGKVAEVVGWLDANNYEKLATLPDFKA